MSPAAIAGRAAAEGLHAAALTDHNSALNCRAFKKCCGDFNILPVFGLEVTSIEEAHIVCLFETAERAEELGEIIYRRLPEILNTPERFGDQVYVDPDENILGEVEKYLLNATDISLDELFEIVMGLEGLFIPAHIDRPVFSIPSQLGFLPEMNYSALETTVLPCPVETGSHRLIMNSDAHYVDDIGTRFTEYEIEDVLTGGLSFFHIKQAVYENRLTAINKKKLP